MRRFIIALGIALTVTIAPVEAHEPGEPCPPEDIYDGVCLETTH